MVHVLDLADRLIGMTGSRSGKKEKRCWKISLGFGFWVHFYGQNYYTCLCPCPCPCPCTCTWNLMFAFTPHFAFAVYFLPCLILYLVSLLLPIFPHPPELGLISFVRRSVFFLFTPFLPFFFLYIAVKWDSSIPSPMIVFPPDLGDTSLMKIDMVGIRAKGF